MNAKRPRRLDLNAPLLSTKRSTATTTTTTISSLEVSRTTSLGGSCDRVPFSWEQSPGKPKDAVINKDNMTHNGNLPLPKPPPIRWQLFEESTLLATYGDGFDGHVDNVNDDSASFSDAMDMLSIAETQNTTRSNTREEVDLESEISDHNYGSSSPNFMIQRFLPAANALAVSSLSGLPRNKDQISCNTIEYRNIMPVYSTTRKHNSKQQRSNNVGQKTGQVYSSSKGCGLEMLFPWPWRQKHCICGVKSPVRRPRSSLKPQPNPRNK